MGDQVKDEYLACGPVKVQGPKAVYTYIFSGAGIGWLNASSHLAGTGTTTSQATAVGTGGPSPGYIQSLLNLDESVLEASLTNGGKTQQQIPPRRVPMPPKTHAVASPPITPGDESGVLFAQDTATSKNVTSHKHI